MAHFRKIILPLIIYCGISQTALAGDFDFNKFSAGIDAIFSSIPQYDAPGCSVGVIEDGKFIHKAGYGMANLELDVPLSADSIFRMASVSKQFTATAVHLLADQGLIDLDEDIRTYLPELNDYGQKVTIRQMLGHVSGMGDYNLIAGSYEGEKVASDINLKSAAGGPFRLGNEDYLTIEEFYDVIKKVKLIHDPMSKAEYSNFAYFLFSMLVEKQSGLSLREYSQKYIFSPLAMDKTFFSDDGLEVIKNRATGYKAKKDGGYQTDMTNMFVVGDGGLHTSINEFIKWDNHFYTPKLGKDPETFIENFNRANSPLKMRDALYANGQFIDKILDRNVFAHSGGWLGFSTYYVRFPDQRLSIATLCSDVNQEPGKHSLEIAKLYFIMK